MERRISSQLPDHISRLYRMDIPVTWSFSRSEYADMELEIQEKQRDIYELCIHRQKENLSLPFTYEIANYYARAFVETGKILGVKSSPDVVLLDTPLTHTANDFSAAAIFEPVLLLGIQYATLKSRISRGILSAHARAVDIPKAIAFDMAHEQMHFYLSEQRPDIHEKTLAANEHMENIGDRSQYESDYGEALANSFGVLYAKRCVDEWRRRGVLWQG